MSVEKLPDEAIFWKFLSEESHIFTYRLPCARRTVEYALAFCLQGGRCTVGL